MDGDLVICETLDRKYVQMLMILSCACCGPRVVAEEGFIKCLQSYESSHEVLCVEPTSLILRLFRDHEKVLLSSWILVEEKSMVRCQVLFDADPTFKGLEVDIALPIAPLTCCVLLLFQHSRRCFFN